MKSLLVSYRFFILSLGILLLVGILVGKVFVYSLPFVMLIAYLNYRKSIVKIEINNNIKKLIDENAQSKLRTLKSESEMSTFFNITPAFLGIASTTQFIRISKEFSIALGYSVEEIISTPFLSLIHPDDVNSTLDIIKFAQAGNVIINYENRYLKKNGDFILIKWQAILVDDIFYVAGTDITKEKELNFIIKTNEEKFRRLFEGSSISMCIFDRVLYEFTDVNKSFCDELGYTKENIPSFKNLIHPDDYMSSVVASQETMIDPTSTLNMHYENRFITKDGKVRFVLWESSRGNDRFVYCTAHFRK